MNIRQARHVVHVAVDDAVRSQRSYGGRRLVVLSDAERAERERHEEWVRALVGRLAQADRRNARAPDDPTSTALAGN